MKQWGFLIDLSKCIGCRGCEMACINENRLTHIRYRRVIDASNPDKNFFAHMSLACNHCANPECMRVCPKKCYQKRRDGIVIHNPAKCTGCQRCVGACPFRVPKLDPQTGRAGKCCFCVARIEQKQQPACIAACIPGALSMIDITLAQSDHVQETVPEYAMANFTKPSVRFILPRPVTCYWRNS